MYSEWDAGPSLHSVGVNAIGFFDLPPVPLEKEVNVGCQVVALCLWCMSLTYSTKFTWPIETVVPCPHNVLHFLVQTVRLTCALLYYFLSPLQISGILIIMESLIPTETVSPHPGN